MKKVDYSSYKEKVLTEYFQRMENYFSVAVSKLDVLDFLRFAYSRNSNVFDRGNIQSVRFNCMNQYNKEISIVGKNYIIELYAENQYFSVTSDEKSNLKKLYNYNNTKSYRLILYIYTSVELDLDYHKRDDSSVLFDFLNIIKNYQYTRFFYMEDENQRKEIVYQGELTKLLKVEIDAPILILKQTPLNQFGAHSVKNGGDKFDEFYNYDMPVRMALYQDLADKFTCIDKLGPYAEFFINVHNTKEDEILIDGLFARELFDDDPKYTKEEKDIIDFLFKGVTCYRKVSHLKDGYKHISYSKTEDTA